MKHNLLISNRLFSTIFFAVLMLCGTNAWGAVYATYSVSDLTQTSLTYEKSGLSSNDQKLNKGERKVEVPCASASGTLYLSGTSAQSTRFASIYGTNGTVLDASRKIAMTDGYGSGISFTADDILTDGGKYYIIFGNVDDSDYKINAFKYTLSSSCTPSCTAPTSVAITGTTSYTEGQTISLTATPTGGSGTASYQWYKGGTASGNKITGATSATFSKASCTTSDAGNYYCEVSTGSTCSTFSSACPVSVSAAPTGTMVYLKPNANWLEKDGSGVDPRFAVYYYGTGGNGWVSMTLEDACVPTYSAEIPDGAYDKCIFCRMDGAAAANEWSNKYNQTGDLTVPTGNAIFYAVPAGWWDTSGDTYWQQAPLGVCVSGTWLRFTDETITLTATCAGATNFQWYKGGTGESNKITGATSATYTKTNCTIDDVGNYYCKAWKVAGQEATSEAMGVKIPYLEYQTPGSGSDYRRVALTRTGENEWAQCSVYPGVAWEYEFAINDGFTRYGNSGIKDRANSTEKWTMSTDPAWCRWNTDKEGTYHFYIDFKNATLTPILANIVYPPMTQSGGHHLYMEKTSEMVTAGWDKIFYRIGKGKYSDGDPKNYATAQLMTLVPGTDRFYETTTPEWSADFWAWHIANNCGSQGDGFAIYQTHSSSEYEITQSINFDGDEIENDSTYYVHISSGDATGGDWLNNNCTFRGHSATVGMLQHNLSVGATTNGKLRIEYTHYDNTSQSSEASTARNFNGLAHTCIITITGVPDCGYRIATLTVNGVPFPSGSTHILDANATIAATFTDDTYSVTLNTNGGTINSGNVTSYTHGTGATLPTDVTNGVKAFGGWYDNSGLTGSPVTAISTTDCGDKVFYAKWTDCPAYCSGETLYKFEVNSSVADANICSSGHNPQSITTSTQLSSLIGGTLEGYITNNSSWNNLVFSGGRISYKNGDKGVLILTLTCPIQEGDLIRFNNYSGSNDKYNYLRHTSNSTTAGQLKLNASKTASEIQELIAPAAFDGKTVLYIVSGSNTTGISYFEIIRPVIVTLNANGGTVDGNATKEVKAALSDVIALPHAFKDGYRFKGWYDAPSGGSPAADAYTVTGCTTLYAQYEDCPDRGVMYKFEVGTGLTNGSVTASNVAFDFNTDNYLTTLIGGTLSTDGSTAHKVLIANTNAISITDNGAYLRIDLDCEIESGDVFKSTVSSYTTFVSKEATRPSGASAAPAILPIGSLVETPIPAALVGEKTLYLWKGSGNTVIQYFEITRPSQTVITLDATGANNHYTTSVIAKYGSEMPEIAVLPTRVGYVFQGYYDGAGGTGTQYYSATGESMLNWDKDVSSYTLYAKWETPCEIAPTLTNVAPVVTIWDQHPVDISLVKLSCPFDTTGILHYSLASVSPTDPITGCEFKYFDDYIHIMGTPTLYNTSVVTVDVTFTITNDCSPAVTATITQTIQIYPKDQKARIAFIVTGTEGGAFNAYNGGNASSCNTLVTYLRQFYTVDYVNGYATKDPVALATYYDDYDLLVVTDYLETNKGYTNAIGTLIDKKPILSFEAYVAKESNWHIGSNPKDPSPKVQDMKVLCAGHAIFSDDSYYSTPVDVVNADTIVHVLDALSTEDDAKGLQGFVINEAPDFIFLATIKDANNKRDLVVCCERQVVFPARLLLFGINFYEMPNLSSAGQIIIRQMIDYLLMTDETKIADCSLVFDNGRDNTGYDEAAYHAAGGTGTKGDGLWTTAANWAPGYNIIPTPYHPTRIIAECHVNVDDAHAGSVKVNKGRDEHGKPVDGKLIIKPYGGLTVAGMVAKVNDTRYASPITIKAEDLLIEADETHNGGFVYGNKESDVRATVQYYSRGEGAYTTPVWQYMGIPFQANQTAIQMYYAAWMCRWSSATTDGLGGLWQWVDNEDVLLPFEGYAITQENKKTYEFAGKLNPPVTTTIDLDNRDTEGFAFAANSWTAPIKIQEMADEDFVNAEKTIYIYHSGSYANWEANGTPVSAKTGYAATLPGQYASIPIHSSPYISGADSVIPAMQGFFVQTTAADAKLKLVYNKVVYDGSYFKTSTQPMRAPRRSNNGGIEKMQLMVCGANYGGDQVHLLARGDFSEGYEDGWDGRKLEGDTAFVPYLAVVKEAGNMSVAAINDLDDRFLSFRAGKDTEYTVSFNYEGETIYLYDIVTQQVTEIRTGNTYSFTATNKSPLERFLITTHPPRITTDIESITGDGLPVTGVKKFIYEGKIYILSDGIVYDAIGQRVDIGKEVAQ